MSGILGVGTSALLAYQQAMRVTGHNIANVGTDGYTRQRLDLVTRVPDYKGFGALGTGVNAANVTRVMDQFVEQSLNTNMTAEAYHRTFYDFTRQLDNLLGDPNAGLAPALSRFFGAVQDLANDPTSTAARQQLITEGQSLVDRFSQIQGRVQDQISIANGRIGSTVNEINELARGVAEMNRQIVEVRGRSGGRAPNDLLDQRERLVRQLSERVAVTTVAQEDGSLNVFIGQGQSLVVGQQATQLYAQPMDADPTRLDISFRTASSMVVVTDFLSGGSLGAMLDLRENLFDPALNNLGQVALGLMQNFNALHAGNMTLDGQLAGDFFRMPELPVTAARSNSASGLPDLSLLDANALRASDYELRFDGSDWQLRRLSDGVAIASLAPGAVHDFDGLRLDLTNVTAEAAGDSYRLQPMRVSADLGVAINQPRQVGAALPIQVQPDMGNQGNVQVQQLRISDPTDADLRTPLNIVFSAGEYLVDGNPVPLDPSGDTLIEYNGWSLVLRGTPAEGDSFALFDNAGAVGDNRGALALAGLASQRVLNDGTSTLSEAYAGLVADVGIKSQRANLNADVHSRLADEARAQRETISGVNLDEEAANLIKFQQAYQAAAQVVATASIMFDSLLAAVRR